MDPLSPSESQQRDSDWLSLGRVPASGPIKCIQSGARLRNRAAGDLAAPQSRGHARGRLDPDPQTPLRAAPSLDWNLPDFKCPVLRVPGTCNVSEILFSSHLADRLVIPPLAILSTSFATLGTRCPHYKSTFRKEKLRFAEVKRLALCHMQFQKCPQGPSPGRRCPSANSVRQGHLCFVHTPPPVQSSSGRTVRAQHISDE